MKFQTHNQKEINFIGTGYITEINISYKEIKNTFGKSFENGYKVDAMWVIEFEDGTIATIYNYKNGKNYMGKSGTPKTKINEWNIGGFRNTNALELVKSALGLE